MRAELGCRANCRLLVLNRELQESMEKVGLRAVRRRRADAHRHDQTPPEMRWLVMFPKLSGSEMQGAARALHRAVQLQAVAAAVARRAAAAEPGGRAVVARRPAGADGRAAPPEPAHRVGRWPTPAALRAWLRLFECALRRGAARVARRKRRSGVAEHPPEPVRARPAAGGRREGPLRTRPGSRPARSASPSRPAAARRRPIGARLLAGGGAVLDTLGDALQDRGEPEQVVGQVEVPVGLQRRRACRGRCVRSSGARSRSSSGMPSVGMVEPADAAETARARCARPCSGS